MTKPPPTRRTGAAARIEERQRRAGGRAASARCRSGLPVLDQRGSRDAAGLLLHSARSTDVGVATEMLLTKAEQLSDDGACAAKLRLMRSRRRRDTIASEGAVAFSHFSVVWS